MNLRVRGDAAAAAAGPHSRGSPPGWGGERAAGGPRADTLEEAHRAGEGSGLLVARGLRAVMVISDGTETSARVPSPLQPLWEAPGQWLCSLIAWSRLPQGM